MSVERSRLPEEIKHWYGDMICDYTYTLGLAGEKFFLGLKEGKILGTRCPRCGAVWVPPSLYCPDCFEELTDWVEVSDEGTVFTFTVAHLGPDGKPLEEPEIYAFILLDGADGGILHKLGEVRPEEVYIGMRVKAVWAPEAERKGAITDIRYFKPVE